MEKPGNVINALLEKNNMSRKELAERTGVTEKHVGRLIIGDDKITPNYAKKLEYVFDKTQKDWINMQIEYDNSLAEKKGIEGITDAEEEIYKKLTVFNKYIKIKENEDIYEKIIAMRKFLKVSNLEFIDKLNYNAAYRVKVTDNILIDNRILFAWQMLCENRCKTISINKEINIDGLEKEINNLKVLINKDYSLEELKVEINQKLNKYGIAFSIVPNFRGAPVQGFIKETNDKLILCVTTRHKRKDIFWFTFFHELAHIINKDYKNSFVDLTSINSNVEAKADAFAANILIDKEEYRKFVFDNNINKRSITNFAKLQNVPVYIIVGRLQNDGILEYKQYHEFIEYFNEEVK